MEISFKQWLEEYQNALCQASFYKKEAEEKLIKLRECCEHKNVVYKTILVEIQKEGGVLVEIRICKDCGLKEKGTFAASVLPYGKCVSHSEFSDIESATLIKVNGWT